MPKYSTSTKPGKKQLTSASPDATGSSNDAHPARIYHDVSEEDNITGTNDDPVHWRIHTALGGDETETWLSKFATCLCVSHYDYVCVYVCLCVCVYISSQRQRQLSGHSAQSWMVEWPCGACVRNCVSARSYSVITGIHSATLINFMVKIYPKVELMVTLRRLHIKCQNYVIQWVVSGFELGLA